MAFDGTIPSLPNQIGNDIPQMQENFSLLESAQVVDEGSTADGDYIRYENGWQVCVRIIESSSIFTAQLSDSVEGIDIHRSSYEAINFPNTFFTKPKVFYNVGGLLEENETISGRLFSTHSTRINLDSWEFQIVAFGTTFDEVKELSLLAIGRWK